MGIGFGPLFFPWGRSLLPFRRSIRACPEAGSLSRGLTAKEFSQGISVFRVSTPAEQTNKTQGKTQRVPPGGCRHRRSCISKIAAYRSGFPIVSRFLGNIASIIDLSSQILHDQTAPAALLWCVRVLALWYDTPDIDDHVISSAVAVGDDAAAGNMCQLVNSASSCAPGAISPFARLADGDTFSL